MEWTGLAAAITSMVGITTIIFYIWDSTRYRRERQRRDDEFNGHLKEWMENIDEKLRGQADLCFRERKGLWDRLDDCAEKIAFVQGKLNGTPKN